VTFGSRLLVLVKIGENHVAVTVSLRGSFELRTLEVARPSLDDRDEGNAAHIIIIVRVSIFMTEVPCLTRINTTTHLVTRLDHLPSSFGILRSTPSEDQKICLRSMR